MKSNQKINNKSLKNKLSNQISSQHKSKGPSFFEIIFPGPHAAGYEELHQDSEEAAMEWEKYKVKENLDEIEQRDFLDIYGLKNLAITISYLNAGFSGKFIETPVSYYLISTLNATPAQISAFKGLCDFPWTLKFVYGMLSDGVSLGGYRRKPWLFIGWVGFIYVNLILYSLKTPSISMTIMLCFLSIVCIVLPEVVHDTLCVERARLESDESKGMLQTNTFTVRAFGSVIGAVLGAVVYNKPTWGWGLNIDEIFLMQAMFPLLTICFIWPLVELTQGYPSPSWSTQIKTMWETLKLRVVWQPMTFVFVYSSFQIPNMALKNFLVKGLHFEEYELGLLLVGAAIFGWLGLVIYREFFFGISWRLIYIITSFIGFICSLLQLIMIYRINVKYGIPDLFFAIGDEAVAVFVDKIHTMPTRIMFITLIAEGVSSGSEGATYALLTSISTLGSVLGTSIGGFMTKIWDVSNETFESGDFSGMAKLTILLSFIHLIPLAFLSFLPNTKEEQRNLRDLKEKSDLGGSVMLSIITSSIILTILFDVYLIYSE